MIIFILVELVIIIGGELFGDLIVLVSVVVFMDKV